MHDQMGICPHGRGLDEMGEGSVGLGRSGDGMDGDGG